MRPDPAYGAIQAGVSPCSDEGVERNWLPRSECTTVPAGGRSAVALVIASTASSMSERTTVAHDPSGAGILDRAQVELASRARARSVERQ